LVPTNFLHREDGTQVQAVRHDGSDEIAVEIAHWVTADGGRADILHKGTVDYDLHAAFIRIYRDGDHEIVRPYFWVVRAAAEKFYVVFPGDFTELYEEVINGG